MFRLQGGSVDIHRHQPRLPAEGVWNRRALHRDQLGAQKIQSDIVQLLFRQSLAAEPDLKNRHAGGRILNDQRRRGADWKLSDDRLRDRGNLRQRGLNVGRRAEENLDHRDTIQRL